MRKLRKAEQGGIPFLEILLDDTWCQGTVAIPEELIRSAGGLNKKLVGKQTYELVLRIAEKSGITFEDIEENVGEQLVILEDKQETDTLYGWKTDCYVMGKYSAVLKEAGVFEAAVESLLAEAKERKRYAETMDYLEKMVGRREEYYKLDDAIRPILIYKGDKLGHNILTVMAEQLGNALERAGEKVIYFDVSEEPMGNIVRYAMQRFRAIIGVQTYLFSIEMPDEKHYLHEYIYGPKYNFLFDHPIWVVSNIRHDIPDYHVLAPDPNYAAFARRYFHRDAIFFPPAGMTATKEESLERIYDLTFVGNYGEYWSQVLQMHTLEREKRFLANHFLLMMRKHPYMTIETAFARTLEQRGIRLSEEEFLLRLYDVRVAVYCVMKYYRNKVIKTILDSGMQVDVFGNSWRKSPFSGYANIIFHPDVTVEESLLVWRQSKCSLNVMSWHKGGFTERMAGIMMAGAVLVTDDTTYLQGRYDADDLLAFQLDELEKLPEAINEILRDDKKRREMAERAKQKTLRKHTWDKRAEEFLTLLDGGNVDI